MAVMPSGVVGGKYLFHGLLGNPHTDITDCDGNPWIFVPAGYGDDALGGNGLECIVHNGLNRLADTLFWQGDFRDLLQIQLHINTPVLVRESA